MIKFLKVVFLLSFQQSIDDVVSELQSILSFSFISEEILSTISDETFEEEILKWVIRTATEQATLELEDVS
jgi:hypothetical protein